MKRTQNRLLARLLLAACIAAAAVVITGCTSGPRAVSPGETIALGDYLYVTIPAGFTGELDGGAADPSGITQGLMIRSDALKIQVNVEMFKDAAAATADAASGAFGTPKPLPDLMAAAETDGYAARVPGTGALARLAVYITQAVDRHAVIIVTPQPGSEWAGASATDAELARKAIALLSAHVSVRP